MYISSSLALLLVFLPEACKEQQAPGAPAVSRRWDGNARLGSLYLPFCWTGHSSLGAL